MYFEVFWFLDLYIVEKQGKMNHSSTLFKCDVNNNTSASATLALFILQLS